MLEKWHLCIYNRYVYQGIAVLQNTICMLKEYTLPANSYYNFVGNFNNLRMLGY